MTTKEELMNTEPEHHISSKDVEPFLERFIFSNRKIILAVFALLTIFLVYNATSIGIDASSSKYIPLQHPYIQNHMRHANDLSSGLANVKIAVKADSGDIFTKEYIETLRQLNDELFYVKGVDRSKMQSLWTPNVRWSEVTEEGFQGGPVIPATYDGSQASLEQLRQNVLKSGQVGRLVANNFQSTILDVPLYELDPDTREKLNYSELSATLEETIRAKFADQNVSIHIIGFPKKIADLISGAAQVGLFFLGAIAITLCLLFWYSRCLRSTVIPVVCSIIAVFWQLGILNLLGYGIDPYSMLVPFLVFAIGISHAVQIINGIAIEVGKGAEKQLSAQLAFRALYVPGMLALLSDAIGFITLLLIEIQVIQELAIAASIGVAVIILTNLILLPLLMSYVGISNSGVKHAIKGEQKESRTWAFISNFAKPGVATFAVLMAIGAAALGIHFSKDLKIGDLDKGAPELRPDSTYNLDNSFIVDNYSTSSDVLVIMVETPKEECSTYTAMDGVNRLMWSMENVPGVQSTASLVTVAKLVTKGMNEGNPKWTELSRNQNVLNAAVQRAPSGLLNLDCSMVPVIIYLEDHKAETLIRVMAAAQEFSDIHSNDKIKFVLASGNAGVEAATNNVIEASQNTMLLFVYTVVIALCFLTFRSIRAVLCIVIPLALTSILCQALMAHLGIGVKVATLPVIALGVGIGVDYGIYIYSRLEVFIIEGINLRDAYYKTLKTTGKAVSFTGLTLAIGVGTWIWSPIKFQADMGILLTFMFLWNMIGALLLIPALANFLLKPESIIARHKKHHGDVKPAF